MNFHRRRVSPSTGSRSITRVTALLLTLFLPVALFIIGSLIVGGTTRAAAAGGLTVEILAGYNLVVDSNATAPSTYAPSAATVAGRFCNDGGTTLSGVQGFIGDFTGGTPGVYPTRDSTDAAFQTEHPLLANSGTYALNHVGGRVGLDDASRFVGDLGPGECKVQYWHLTYPQCIGGDSPPCASGPVWGETNDPTDDLWLSFDVWATAETGESANQSRTVTMRNMISAMANKIRPNPDGHWFNTDTSQVRPGRVITTNGILYGLGNIRQGFDNDGDFVPDYNAWLQPIGDASYDPSCFRLIRTTGVLTVSRSAGQPDYIFPFEDQLYFTNLPSDNTGAVGEVFYTFLALDGPCSTGVSPYQEVASGFDNEKFNADFGAGVPPVGSFAPAVVVTKTGSPGAVATGGSVAYSIPFQNNGNEAAGLTLSTGDVNMPLVISDTVPAGMQYVGGSAAATFDFSPNTGVTIRYSTDSGQSWSTTDPGDTLSTAPGNRVIIQWWLNDPLPAGASGTASFQAVLPITYSGTVLVENDACASFGGGTPFYCSEETTRVQGTNSIGDTVWRDEDGDGLQGGGEAGLAGINVSLYGDSDADGVRDDGEPLIEQIDTDGSGLYNFSQLPDGDYLVIVDSDDSDLPNGYGRTTPGQYAVTGLSGSTSYTSADFGFGPVLALEKTLISDNPATEGQEVTYTIELTNNRPGDGSGQSSSCTYTFWANGVTTGTGSNAWFNPTYVAGQTPSGALAELNGAFANSAFNQGNANKITGTAFNGSTQAGTITQVEAIIYGYVSANIGTDSIDATLYHLGSSRGIRSYSAAEVNVYTGAANADYFVWDVSALHPNGASPANWRWSDFTGTNWQLEWWLKKSGSGSSSSFYMDSLGFRVTTDESCGGAEDTIDPVPLSDTYDASQLQFLSATPNPNTATTGGSTPYANTGTLSWSNVGPLYAGQTRVITVTFLALEPAGNATAILTNTAVVSGATFSSGRPLDPLTDDAVTDLQPAGSVGDRIWNDLDGDGVQDGGEAGIPNVTVSLYRWDGVAWQLSASTVTDANGNYLFDGLADGDYQVRVDQTSLPGTTVTQTGDPDGTVDNQTDVTLVSANDQLTADFGYQISNTLYGRVWRDEDGAGDQDSDEVGLSGVTVNLNRWNGSAWAAETTTTTDADGAYTFSDLGDADYQVVVDTATLPAGGSWSQTADPDSTVDDQTDVLGVSGGTIHGSYDFGYHQSGTADISGAVYADWNQSIDRDGGEPGFSGVPVTLYADNGAVVATTTTGADGSFQFSNLPDGTFTVVVDETVLPAQYRQTEDYDTGAGIACAPCDGQATVTVSGSPVADVDFGYRPAGYGRIGDYVWSDTDYNGLQGSDESGLDNITVWLELDLNDDGNYARVMTATTAGGGLYAFETLPPGSYRSIVNSADADLPLDGNGNLYVLSTPGTVTITLASGQTENDADFGLARGGIIGDTLYWDANGNADADWNEAGISDVTVELYRNGSDGLPAGLLETTTTASDGTYLFSGLPTGDYLVMVDENDPDLSGAPLTGDPDTNGIPCDPAPDAPWDAYCDSQTVVDLSTGQTFLGADFGYRPSGVIGDFVWLDLNGDGEQASGESGLSGVAISVGNGTITFTTASDFDGAYSFANLGDGTWTVTFEPPAGTLPTLSGSAAVLAGTGSVGEEATVVLSGGQVQSVNGTSCSGCELHIDAGFRPDEPYELSGTIFYDSGNDGGIYDSSAGDTPLANVTVYLWDGDGYVGATTSDANGAYAFTSLPGGDYTVSVNPNSTAFDNSSLTTLAPASPQSYLNATLNSGNPSSTDNDFGFYHDSPMDFGDLPATYELTTLGDGGPRHIIGALYLGSGVTADADGCPNATSNCDGLDDGVAPLSGDSWEAGNTVQLRITVTGSNGYVTGWFDWNGDGDIVDSGEKVTFGTLSAGANTVNLVVPGSYATGTPILARFRLYDGVQASTSPAGMVTNGETEDYYWTFTPTAVGLSQDGQLVTDRSSLLIVLLLTGLMGLTGSHFYRRHDGILLFRQRR